MAGNDGQDSTRGRLYGAVEAGGTKFVCAIGDAAGRALFEERFDTTDPVNTLSRMVASLRAGQSQLGELNAIGLASFGPIELAAGSPRFGTIGRTPKAGWTSADILGALAGAFSCPIGVDTDVNAAALAEHRWGAARDVADVVYVTVGTGIGGGVLVAGHPIHGLMHPEIGHVYPRRHPEDLGFAGICPFHGDCLEGVASGPAIIARSGAPLSGLAEHHPQWAFQADYLGQLCAQLVLTVSPQRIIMGGGVMAQTGLFAPIRTAMRTWLAGYVDRHELAGGVDGYVVPPGLGARAGVLGAVALAMDADAGR